MLNMCTSNVHGDSLTESCINKDDTSTPACPGSGCPYQDARLHVPCIHMDLELFYIYEYLRGGGPANVSIRYDYFSRLVTLYWTWPTCTAKLKHSDVQRPSGNRYKAWELNLKY